MSNVTYVIVLETPITERYCKIGDICKLNNLTNRIKCSGAWFNFDDRWKVEPVENN